MSKDIIVAKRYAKALFAAAKDQNLVQQVEAELKAVIAVLQEQRDLHKLIQHPGVDVSAKTNLLKEIFSGTVSELVFATLVLLVERRREGALEAVVDSYVAIANEALGQANATVYTPVALSETELSGIAAPSAKLRANKSVWNRFSIKACWAAFKFGSAIVCMTEACPANFSAWKKR